MTPGEFMVRMAEMSAQFSHPRRLVAGHVAWEIIKSAALPAAGETHPASDPVTRLFGMRVVVDPDMPACAWKVVETDGAGADRAVAEHDWAPGFTHAYWDAENRKAYAYNPGPMMPADLGIWEGEADWYDVRRQRWWL